MHLLREFGFEGLLAVGDVGLVAGGVDEGVAVAGDEALIFFGEVEVAAVGSEKDVAGEALEDGESAAVVGGDLRVSGIVDELVAGIDVGATDDDDVEGARALCALNSRRAEFLFV